MDMAKDKILVVELTTAGGIGSGKERLEAISIEGLAMVHALVADAVDGDFETHVILQDAIEDLPSLASTADVHWHRTGSGTDLKEKIKEIAPSMNYCFIVAPEFGGYLDQYTRLLESYGCVVLSQPSAAVAVASNKAHTIGWLSQAGIHVPFTQTLNDFANSPAIQYPIVVKPNHGAGSIGVFVVHDEAELKDAISKAELRSFPREELIVQDFISGIALSVSAIAYHRGTKLLGINEQDMVLSTPQVSESKYRGGVAGPLHPELVASSSLVSRLMARGFQFRGYFGFDFILDAHGNPFVVEINPRLTTSFVGLKMLYRKSVLRFMVNRLKNKRISMPWISRSGFVAYRIVSLPGSAKNMTRKTDLRDTEKVVSINMPGGGISAFIAVRGQTRESAINGLDRLAMRLQRNEDEKV